MMLSKVCIHNCMELHYVSERTAHCIPLHPFCMRGFHSYFLFLASNLRVTYPLLHLIIDEVIKFDGRPSFILFPAS